MSEEVAMAIADENNRRRVAELDRLRRWAAAWRASARAWRHRARHQTERRIYWRARYRAVLDHHDELHAELSATIVRAEAAEAELERARRSSEPPPLTAEAVRNTIFAADPRARAEQAEAELTAARERERIAAEAYNGQQTSQRELEMLYQDALRRLAEMQTVQAGAAVLRNALQWYADRVYSHTMGLPPEVQWIAEDALKRTTAGAEPADADPTRAQLLGAQSALRNAMDQTEASKRLIAGMLGQAPAEPADDDGHGKPYLNEM